MKKKVFGCVWLGWAPGAVWLLDYPEAVQVGVEAGVADPQADDGRLAYVW